MNYLPINLNILNTHNADCWAYYCYLYRTTTHTFMNFNNNSITIKLTLRAEVPADREFADLCRSSWSKYHSTWEKQQLLIIDTPTTMMPHEVFEKLYEVIMRLSVRSRNSYFRLYMYMYYHCHNTLNDYGTTIERLAAELQTNHSLISSRIKYFIDAGLLRRMGKFNPELGIPYRYFIPPELGSGLN